MALTFFAYLGFGVIAFTGGDLENPKKNLPRAMYISLGFTMLLYVALAVGVFGTLTVQEVIANADTALAVAALPIFGEFGYTMISIAAIFATTGAINSQLYASIGATFFMAKEGHLPPVFGLKRRRREAGTQGLVISALLILLMANLFDVTAIASIGSACLLYTSRRTRGGGDGGTEQPRSAEIVGRGLGQCPHLIIGKEPGHPPGHH